MSTHLYAVFARTVIAAGSDVLTLMPDALRHDNCTCKLGQQLSVQLCLMFQGNSPWSLQERVWVVPFWGTEDDSGTVTGLVEAENLQVLSILRAPVFSVLQVGSEGRLNSPNIQAKQERRWYCHLRGWMLKHVPTHLKVPLSRKAAEKGPRLTNLSYDKLICRVWWIDFTAITPGIHKRAGKWPQFFLNPGLWDCPCCVVIDPYL